MTPRIQLLLGGASLIIVALVGFLTLATEYWPFQPVVQVIAPFLALSVLISVGLSLIFTVLLTSQSRSRSPSANDQTWTIDSLLDETKRRR